MRHPAIKHKFPNPLEKDKPVTLLDLKDGETASILRITSGKHLKTRMSGLGIREGKCFRLIRSAPFSGPLLLEDTESGARVMIGRGMAASVEVCNQAPSR